MPDYLYDVALSFAGEDREVARRIAQVAQANGLRVYFDEHYLWETWGEDLTEALGRIYTDQARYCVLLVSEDYCSKPYTTFERRMALARALESKEEYLLPVLLDDSWPPGLPRTTAYLDLRTSSTTKVGEALVRKVRGEAWVVREVDSRALPVPEPVPAPPVTPAASSALVFADVTVAEPCRAWSEAEPSRAAPWSSEPARWTFRGGAGWYEDPIFDITILNRSSTSTLITRIGIEVLGASFGTYAGLGGGSAEPVHLHRTYELPLPDVWAALASGLRAEGYGHDDKRWPYGPVKMAELCSCRLPDPILVDPGRAYRFGLHLLDYTSLCPTEVELTFLAQTDQGRQKSERARLNYLIGGDIEPLERFQRILGGQLEEEDQIAKTVKYGLGPYREWEWNQRIEQMAYSLWDKSGRPEGRQDEFWEAGKREVGRTLLINRSLQTVHRRDL